jgi:hypothetical protein
VHSKLCLSCILGEVCQEFGNFVQGSVCQIVGVYFVIMKTKCTHWSDAFLAYAYKIFPANCDIYCLENRTRGNGKSLKGNGMLTL